MLESIGVVTPLYGFANITVNGEPWGLYFSVEVLEESFAQRNYGSDYGKIYKPESDMAGGGGGPQEAGEPGENPKQAELGSLGDSQETDSCKAKQERSASENAADTQEEEPSQTSSSSEETQAGTDSRRPEMDFQTRREGNQVRAEALAVVVSPYQEAVIWLLSTRTPAAT